MIADVVERHRLIVCVGAGGVGKTTIAAAIALGAARRGRHAAVLTIDPARALARAFGLPSLPSEPAPVPGLEVAGRLDAGMLDAKHAWDAFVTRHAPTGAVAHDVLANPFYQQLSTSFAGSTEYMAIEEMCRLAESGRHDLIVLDTPPAAHALDFLGAPERLDRLLDPRISALVTRPAAGAGKLARLVLARLERAAGRRTLQDVTAFFVALTTFLDRIASRTRRARALLRGRDAAFVLVAGPRQVVVAETVALADRMRALDTPLAAVVLNRVHAPPPGDARILDTLAADRAALTWLRAIWNDAVAEAAVEGDLATSLAASLPPGIACTTIPELSHDVHSLADLGAMADVLWTQASGLRPQASGLRAQNPERADTQTSGSEPEA